VVTGQLTREQLSAVPHDYILGSVAELPGLQETQP
jgi:phosphoglycolate phosphatase-like HAD superfamily hydrolase